MKMAEIMAILFIKGQSLKMNDTPQPCRRQFIAFITFYISLFRCRALRSSSNIVIFLFNLAVISGVV